MVGEFGPISLHQLTLMIKKTCLHTHRIDAWGQCYGLPILNVYIIYLLCEFEEEPQTSSSLVYCQLSLREFGAHLLTPN